MLDHLIAWLYWNPERVLFTVPYIDRPVVWYGVLFVFGFVVAYFLLLPMFKALINPSKHKEAVSDLSLMLVDRLTWFVVAGTLIGARLGHVLFYDWPRYQEHPLEIIKIWEGGLASHGGALGVLFALFLFYRSIRKRFPEFSFLNILDILAVPTAFAVACIRIGNFFNQEILGRPSSVPWAVIFGDPFDGGAVVPRHPVQLYEAGMYLLTFVLLEWLWHKRKAVQYQGLSIGILFTSVFASRFLLDFLKEPQSLMVDETQMFLQTGQLLSIPFVLLGTILIYRSRRTCGSCTQG